MPLIIEQQPSVFIPHELKPTEWIVRKTDFFVQEGEAARIVIVFNAGSGSPGQNITLNGQQFMTDSSTSYTAETWDYAATPEQAAKNFANMLRSSYAFAEWSVIVREIGGDWNVIIEYPNNGAFDPFENNLGTLTPSVVGSFQNGVDEVRSDDRFWYQFWEGNEALTEQKFAAFDNTGRVRVDTEPLSRQVLGANDPYLLWSGPTVDDQMSRSVYLRFGTYNKGIDCTTSFGQSYESPEITIVNSIFQHDLVRRFTPFTPNYTLPVRWMTARDNDHFICNTSYEWTSIFLQRTALFPDGFWKVEYVYYDTDGNQLDTKTSNLTNRETGVYRIPTGPGNAIHPNSLSNAAYYTIQVTVEGSDGNYIAYSEMLTIRLNNCNCWAAEVYYLEDAGSWRTVVFEKIEERRIEMSAVEWNSPIEYSRYGGTADGIRLFQNGGKESYAENVDSVYSLVTERITSSNRKAYEELLRSSRHIILTTSDFFPTVTRRVILERGTYGVYRTREATRLVIPFRFNTYQNVR